MQTVDARVGQAPDGTYVVGEQLSTVDASALFYPIENGVVRDWDALEALWRHVLLDKLNVQPADNAYYVALALPSPVSRDVYERSAQLLFEKFNMPALTISEIPLLAAYAVGVLSALVVDVGIEDSRVTAVSDCQIVPSAAVVTKLGLVHCTWWLAYLLQQDSAVASALAPVADGDLDAACWALAQQLVADRVVYVDAEVSQMPDEDEGVLDVAQALVEGRERDVVAEHEREKQASAAHSARAAASAQHVGTTRVSFRGIELEIGAVRTRFHEPLLRPALLERVSLRVPVPRAVQQALQARRLGGEPPCVSISDTAAMAAANVHPMERRVTLWENVLMTGATSQVKGLSAELLRSLSEHLTSEPTEATQVVGEPNPWQAHTIRALRIPDYFGAFKEQLQLAAYLGALIYAKLAFGDTTGRNYITKKQYNEGGPSVAFAMGSV